MALPAEFSLLDSEYGDFLFATIGEERTGMPLSVLSALTRLGLDPWLEAARLSDLPKNFAIATLSDLIARLPVGRWELSETRGIAVRLIQFLPPRGSDTRAETAKADAIKRGRRSTVSLIVVILGAAALGMVASTALPWVSGHVSRSVPGTQSAD